MSLLDRYHKKRDFNKTPEPHGKEKDSTGALEFVVQKHDATRLHYDFRLEMDGVMKSWAVPKGPSSDPEVKRLAMETEDHPMEYNKFEGIIPKGQYGGGTVMIWDTGNYMPEGISKLEESNSVASSMYHKGEIKFVINGKKIKGSYVLVKTPRTNAENSWLLIKHSDEYANKDDLTSQDKSVITGRDLDELAKGAKEKNEIWNSNQSIDLNSAPKGQIPHDVKPMLATLTDKAFDSKDFIFEIKWDGYRAISEVTNGKAKIYSRNLQSFNELYRPIVDSLEKSDHQMVLDGEVVILDDEGKPNFGLMQNYKKTRKGNLVYYVFDILYLDGHGLTQLSLIKRKDILSKVLPAGPNIQLSTHIEEKGIAFFEAAKKQNLEGVMAKKIDSTYQTGRRSENWLKIKSHHRQEAIICGFTEPRGSRKHLGALILGVYEEGKLKYIGHTGGKINDASLKDLRTKLEKIETKESPFTEKVQANAPVHWVKPIMICEVSFQEWTEGGHMRIPIFEGLREDKDPQEVRIEKEEPIKEVAKNPQLLTKSEKNDENDISHPDKILWPDDGYTKKDLLKYYEKIADTILPYLKDRPESLLRNPNGTTEEGFFQKNMEGHLPDFTKTVKVHSEHEERDVNYLICNNRETLLYMANLGCIQLNPWNSTTQNLDKPTWMVMDLDPEDIGFDAVVKVANVVQAVLEGLEITSYPKTSGATGIHVFVPMGDKYNYDQVKQLAEIIANLVHERIPEITSVERMPNKRKGKVYVDFLQNRKGQTLAAPYSLRPRPKAPVSTPLNWSEVNEKLDPTDFNIKTIFERLEEMGDIWKEVIGRGVDISKILKRMNDDFA